MKVVLFCGGMGMRLREYSDSVPKPMAEIGYRPILWHLMKYYAHYGHTDFILCLGYRGDVIKKYFLNYDECLSNDFTLTKGGKDVQLFNSDISNWTITFVDTGLNANIGQRLKAVEKYLQEDDVFMANYADGLTDLPLPQYIDHFQRMNKMASFVSVRSNQSFHIVSVDGNSLVKSIAPVSDTGFWINGGFFIFKKEIFQYIQPGEELVQEPFQRLIAQRELITYQYPGFWACMDTFKEKQHFDDLYARGEMPWAIWKSALPSPVLDLHLVSQDSRYA